MADDKSEQPTEKRLRDAREKGQIAKSTDLTQAALFLVAAAMLSFTGPTLVSSLKAFMVDSFSPALMGGSLDASMFVARVANASVKFLLLILPFLVGLAVTAIAVTFAQLQGFIFTLEALSLKVEKFNPVTGIQNIFFKGKTYLEVAKGLLKFIVVFWIAYLTLKSDLRDLVISSRIDLLHVASFVPKLLFNLLFKVAAVFIVLGAADFFVQKKMHTKSLMMSKEEVKQEHKNEEGDPHIKHERRHLHLILLHEMATKQVPTAKAVVVNPTHIAIALQYDEARMNAPTVVAKGEMFLAQRIVKLAKEHNVPIIQNIALARTLVKLELDEEVPEGLYETVAEILKLAERLAHGDKS
jgi:flagellar biosynthesis protein FlhB